MRGRKQQRTIKILQHIIEKQKAQVEMCDHQIKKLCPSGNLPNFREIEIPVEAALWFEVNLKNVIMLDISGLELVMEYLNDSRDAVGLLRRAYAAINKSEWEAGETEIEICDAINDFMSNHFGGDWNQRSDQAEVTG